MDGRLKSIKRNFKKPTSKQNISGQALVEYVLLIAIAVSISVTLLSTFTNLINRQGVPRFNAVLESELRTSSLPRSEHVTLWEN